MIKTPRWQQAYGKSYSYSGTINQALKMPIMIEKMRSYFSGVYGCDFNMALINWYNDGSHYIGFHSDDTRQIKKGTPIVTISLLESRRFAIRKKKQSGNQLVLKVKHNDVLVMGGDF